MKIASIHIYSHDGRRRDLTLNSDGLNIITGLASTGAIAAGVIEGIPSFGSGIFAVDILGS